MLPIGFSLLIVVFILKAKRRKILNPAFIKCFVGTALILRIDYALYFLLHSNFNSKIEYYFILHSLFVAFFIFLILGFFSEFYKKAHLKNNAKTILASFLFSILISVISNIVPVNHFWPIFDNDLKFSLLSAFFFNDIYLDLAVPLFITLEVFSLILCSEILIMNTISINGSAKNIKKISILAKIQKYLFMIYLVIFFVIYGMNFLNINSYSTFFLVSYLISIFLNLYVLLKTEIKI